MTIPGKGACMFELKRSIFDPTFSNERLFEKAEDSIFNLMDNWDLKSPELSCSPENLEITMLGKNFSGTIKVQDKTLQIEATFNNFFDYDKAEAEQQLKQWIESVFDSSYDM